MWLFLSAYLSGSRDTTLKSRELSERGQKQRCIAVPKSRKDVENPKETYSAENLVGKT